MRKILKATSLAGLGLSGLMWLAFLPIQLLHAESVAFPLIALLATGFLISSVLASSRALAALAAIVALLPIALLVVEPLTGGGSSPGPLPIHLLVWSWALFHGYVAAGLVLQATIIPGTSP